MKEVVTLFKSLLQNLLESFSSDCKECFTQFEVQSIQFLNCEKKLDEKLESIFLEFPESNFKYKKTIKVLISFAKADPVSILSDICDQFIKELNRTKDQESEILKINLNSKSYLNFYSFHFTQHLNLIILTDLIKEFFIQFPNRPMIQKAVSCGYKLCASSISDIPQIDDNFFNSSNSIFSFNFSNVKNNKNNKFLNFNTSTKSRLSKLKYQLIESWSFIFHYISKLSMEEITFSLEQYSDYVSTGHLFTLVSKVSSDSAFIELLLYTLQNCQKRKQITSEMLSSLTSLFLTVKDIKEEVLSDFFSIAWSLKENPNLKEEAIELICVLFNRLPKFQTKATQFYSSKIYKHADNDKKVERSARGFLCKIRGDVSQLTVNSENPQYFNCSGKSPNDSFAVIFIKTFFERSNFNVCIRLFSQILAHLASIDIVTFERIIVPHFVKLNFLSSKFVSFAVALKIINSDTFLKENYCKSTKSQINEINMSFKKKIVCSFQELLPYVDDKYMVMTRKVLKNSRKIDNADNIVIDFISNNGMQNISSSSISPKIAFTEEEEEEVETTQSNISLSENKSASNSQSEISSSHDSFQKKRRHSALRPSIFKFGRTNNPKAQDSDSGSSAKTDDALLSTPHLNKHEKEKLSLSAISDLIQVIPCITDLDVLKTTDIVIIIIRFMCHYDKEISASASEVFNEFLKIDGSFEIIVNQILNHLTTSTNEITAKCLHLLYKMIKAATSNSDSEFTNDSDFNISLSVPLNIELFQFIEVYAFCCLVNDSSYCRLIALNILKLLSLMSVGSIYKVLHQNSSKLTDLFNKSIFILKTPFNPSLFRPIIGNLSMENVCISRFNDFWLLFFSNIINVLISCANEPDKKDDISSIILKCREIVQEIYKIKNTNFSKIASSIIYIDSFCFDTELKELKSNTNINASYPEFDMDIKKIKMHDFDSILDLLESGDIEKKRDLIHICSLLNSKITLRILPKLLTVENELYPDVAESLVFLIQNPESSKEFISSIFPILIKFLKLLQNYFTFLGINSTREIVWDDEHIELLKLHQNLCINYCKLNSLSFKNIQENNIPLILRQVQLKFLFHWSQLPTDKEPEFIKLKTYSLNTLILIINSGPVFIEGFLFDSNFFDLMIHCEMKGKQVLHSLLSFHFNILIDEFVKCCLIRPKDQSQFFLTPILTIIKECSNVSLLENHIGSLILLSIMLRKEKSNSFIPILTKIDSLFINVIELTNEKKVKFDKYSELDIPEYFAIATGQVIDIGLNILHEIKSKKILFKSIVESIVPFFNKIHLLPTKRFIIQGVSSKYQRFTTVSFFNLMFNVSCSLDDDDELIEFFSLIWFELLKNTDNSMIILLLIFENSNENMKKKIFMNLLDKDPITISKFLSKRCTFAYWYFMKTQLHQSIDKIFWMIPILSRAFTVYFEYASQHFINCLHFSFLFVEDCKELFEALLSAFRFESVDCNFVWTSEGSSDIIQATYIIDGISMILSESNSNEIINWAQEAIRWSVACNDINIGYRSLFILKMLQPELPQSIFPLFSRAVSYHFSSIYDNFGDQANMKDHKLSLFVGECFDILYHQMNNSDLATFGFSFASLFLNCQFLDNECLKRAMPIFQACTKHMVLMSMAQAELTDAFLPFIPDLEHSSETQVLLGQIADKNTPELLIVASAFLRKNLPFDATISFDKKNNSSETSPNNSFLFIKNQSDENQVNINAQPDDSENADQQPKKESELSDDYSYSEEEEEAIIEKTENEKLADKILSMTFRLNRVQKALKIFSKLLISSSQDLTDSIFDVCSILVNKSENQIDVNSLIPIFLAAIKNVSTMTGAKNFIKSIVKTTPQIIQVIAEKYSLNIDYGNFDDYSEDDNFEGSSPHPNSEGVYFDDEENFEKDHKRSRCECMNLVNLNLNINLNSSQALNESELEVENRKKAVEEIKKRLNDLDESPLELVPITNCKQLSHLNGMIDQASPPTISPFASQFELISKLMKDDQKQLKRNLSHAAFFVQSNSALLPIVSTSSGSIAACAASPSSPALPQITQKQQNRSGTPSAEKNLKLDVIPKRPIILKLLNVETDENPSRFLVKPAEFLELKE